MHSAGVFAVLFFCCAHNYEAAYIPGCGYGGVVKWPDG